MLKLLFSLILFLYASNCFAADINIKLRKTDFNELKQQLIPQFEQKIVYLETMTDCLISETEIKTCIEQLPVLKEEIKNWIDKNIIDREDLRGQLVDGLKQFITEANEAKDCLIRSQSINEAQLCALKYK
jgi:hypothetical protein